MAFMTPLYTNEPFVLMENQHGEGYAVPIYAEPDFAKEGFTTFDRVTGKWFCRLSANGYMDCTDWSGPFDTLAEARECIEIEYQVDPDTGDDLDETD